MREGKGGKGAVGAAAHCGCPSEGNGCWDPGKESPGPVYASPRATTLPVATHLWIWDMPHSPGHAGGSHPGCTKLSALLAAACRWMASATALAATRLAVHLKTPPLCWLAVAQPATYHQPALLALVSCYHVEICYIVCLRNTQRWRFSSFHA